MKKEIEKAFEHYEAVNYGLEDFDMEMDVETIYVKPVKVTKKERLKAEKKGRAKKVALKKEREYARVERIAKINAENRMAHEQRVQRAQAHEEYIKELARLA